MLYSDLKSNLIWAVASMIIKVLIKKLSKLIKSFTKHLSPEVFF